MGGARGDQLPRPESWEAKVVSNRHILQGQSPLSHMMSVPVPPTPSSDALVAFVLPSFGLSSSTHFLSTHTQKPSSLLIPPRDRPLESSHTWTVVPRHPPAGQGLSTLLSLKSLSLAQKQLGMNPFDQAFPLSFVLCSCPM